MNTTAFVGTNPEMKPTLCIASRLGTVPEVSGIAGFRLPMKPTVEYHDSLERMKLYAGSQSRDEPYSQDHGGDNPSPAAFDFGHLESPAGTPPATHQFPHPCHPPSAPKR